MTPRYPELHVQVHSKNPFTLISAVRLSLRRSKVRKKEIDAFTESALERTEPKAVRDLCAQWVEVRC